MATNALIIYYSQYGDTAKLASQIHKVTGCDILRIDVAPDVFSDDVFETEDIYKDQLASHTFPELITELPDLGFYDVILVGGPVWDGDVASPVIALLNRLQGYKGLVVPFSTASTDSRDYDQNFRDRAGSLHVGPGFHIVRNYSDAKLASWLRKL
ncbi:MAG: flavodoxin [Limosilactobacillus sp.]|nr:flavodoxin [Limosilactobacillus sp.]